MTYLVEIRCRPSFRHQAETLLNQRVIRWMARNQHQHGPPGITFESHMVYHQGEATYVTAVLIP